ERVSQHLCRPDSFSGLAAGCVVQRRNQRLTRAQEFWQVFDNGVEQGMRFPAALGEKAVLWCPTAKLPSQNADRPADRATAEADQHSQRMVFGATVCPVIRKHCRQLPSTSQKRRSSAIGHLSFSGRTENVLGAVRAKRS